MVTIINPADYQRMSRLGQHLVRQLVARLGLVFEDVFRIVLVDESTWVWRYERPLHVVGAGDNQHAAYAVDWIRPE